MKKLLLTVAAVATLGSTAQAYYTAGVWTDGESCSVNSTKEQDRDYWKNKVAIPAVPVADSIEYHEARSNGNNFNAAALCWLKDRGEFIEYLEGTPTSPGFSIITYMPEYSDQVDWYMDSGNDIVEMPWNLISMLGYDKPDIPDGREPC